MHRLRSSPALEALLVCLVAACGGGDPAKDGAADPQTCEALACESGACRMEAGTPVCLNGPLTDEERWRYEAKVLDPLGVRGTATTRTREGSATALAAFSITGRTGQKFSFRCDAGSLPGCTVWLHENLYWERTSWGTHADGRGWVSGNFRLPADGTYYLSVNGDDPRAVGTFVYELKALGMDDRPGMELTTPRWEPSLTPFAGQLETPGDVDALQVRTQTGHVYRFACLAPPASMTVGGNLFLWRRGEGEPEYQEVQSRSLVAGATAELFFREAASAELFAGVDSTPDSITHWSYQCTFEDLGHDAGSTAATADPLPIPGEIAAILHDTWDVDAYAVELVAGRLYRASVDRGVVRAIDSEGIQRAYTQREPSFEALVSGRHTLHVSADAPGPYVLRFVDLGLDDHGDTDETASLIGVPLNSLQGRIEIPLDLDVFTFPALQGYTYRFTCDPSAPGLGWDLRMTSSRYRTHALPAEDGTSQTMLEAETNDQFYVEVSSQAGRVGDYSCRLERLLL